VGGSGLFPVLTSTQFKGDDMATNKIRFFSLLNELAAIGLNTGWDGFLLEVRKNFPFAYLCASPPADVKTSC
jgi:hypothetical protein